MSREKPEAVLRRALKNFKSQMTTDDWAVVLGALLERQQAADEAIWKYIRLTQLYVGLREEVHVAGQSYSKGALIRRGDEIFVAQKATSAPLEDSTDWLRFADMPGAPQPPVPERKRKKIRVVEHDSRGRIKSLVEEWEREDE